MSQLTLVIGNKNYSSWPLRPWLFGGFSIADAMYAPVVIRFSGYCVTLSELEQTYVDCLLKHPAIVEWIAASVEEKEVLESEEAKVI